jgi:hypothetical protein
MHAIVASAPQGGGPGVAMPGRVVDFGRRAYQ